jgi:hypothetical protein
MTGLFLKMYLQQESFTVATMTKKAQKWYTNTTQKSNQRATWASLKPCVNSGTAEGYAVPAPPQKFLICFSIHEICIGLFFAMTGLFLKMYLQQIVQSPIGIKSRCYAALLFGLFHGVSLTLAIPLHF